jgi:protein-ribulosamine 3-kinase
VSVDDKLAGEIVRSAIATRLGTPIVGARALGGGSINDAWALVLGDGRSVFAKANRDAPADMFAAEVHGLAFLREGLVGVEGLCVPEVIACEPTFLVLELLEPGRARADFHELLGRGLASLHRSGAQLEFGLDRANYIGSVPQINDSRPDWPSFYRECRLAPMLARAGSLISTSLRRRFDRLFDRFSELCGPPEPPARLHGDLWSGNLHRDAAGRPVLIDPAVYVGHREMDLAMMRLFGGFAARTFASYAEAWPLADGWERRVDLHQLYPLLVHVVLFGRSYLGSVEAALQRLE